VKRMHIFVSGHVQGVCFRMYTQEVATGHGLVGWVRNLPDRRVEVVAEGEKADLAALANWCKMGPAGAGVADVAVDFITATGEFDDFRIEYGGRYGV
jgi:acylphosphatase